ncbi:hypothetical protein TNCV_3280991 [Trichonephila clavipes]|nr:hypothetical protein TNCV_3280991 [Trichonephila clavipes]
MNIIRDSCPLDGDDWIEFMAVYANKRVDTSEVELYLLTADLIAKGLKFATTLVGRATYKEFQLPGESYMPHQQKHMRHLQ